MVFFYRLDGALSYDCILVTIAHLVTRKINILSKLEFVCRFMSFLHHAMSYRQWNWMKIAYAKNGPTPPARCLAQGACKYHAPACISVPEDLFVCNQATGAWESNHPHIPIDFTVAGPVVFLGNATFASNANITFNESLDTMLTINGFGDFLGANETWHIRVADAQLKEWAKVEASGSTDFNASRRSLVIAEKLLLPEKWSLKLKPTVKCNIPYILDKRPGLIDATFEDGSYAVSFYVYFYTKSQCHWWIVLVGSILAYFALLILVIVAFRTIPALKAWTALPIFDTHMAHRSKSSKNAYEMDTTFRRDSSEEGDSVTLDL